MQDSKTFKGIFLSLLLLGQLRLVCCFTQAGYFIEDLNTNTEAKFTVETSSWSSSVTTQPTSKIYNCTGTYLMGGYNWKPSGAQTGEHLSRFYTGLPAHKTVIYSFTFWALDSWDSNDYFQIQFDALPVIQGYSLNFRQTPNFLCGAANYQDKAGIRVFGKIAHTSLTVSLKFIAYFDEPSTNESFGVRDITLNFVDEDLGGDTICGYAGTVLTLQRQATCSCAPGQYLSGSGGCTGCSKECASCYGSGADKCYECAESYYFNGAKCVKCDSSCLHCTGPNENQCTECLSGFALFHSVCIAESRCSSPFTLDYSPEECHSHCSSASFSIWGESCYPPCPGPQISDLSGICQSCKSLSAQYLRATDTGHQYTLQLSPSSCDLSIENVRRYLTITKTTPNSIGPFSFQVSKTSANNYFINLVLDQSVLEDTSLEAKLSYLTGSLEVPKKLVPDETLKAIAAAVPAAQAVMSGVLGGSFTGTLALGATASLWSIVSFQQFVGYFIYINVEYPFQVELFLSLLQISPWDYLPNPIAALTQSLSKDIIAEDRVSVTPYDPPRKFLKYEKNSFFVENGGVIMVLNFLLLILLGVVLNLKSFEKFKGSWILKKVKVLLRWNFIGRTFLENAIPLSLAVFLQLRIIIFRQAYLIVCIVMALISGLYLFGMTLFFIRSLFFRDNEHLKKKYVKKIFGTFYEGIDLTGLLSKYYNVVILLRGFLVTFLVTFLEARPILQIFPLVIFNAALIYYMMNQVQFENKTLNFIIKLKEILIFGGEMFVLSLVFVVESELYYQVIGYCTVLCFGVALMMEVVYMIVLQICQIKHIGKKMKQLWKVILAAWKYLKGRSREIKIKQRRREQQIVEMPSEIISVPVQHIEDV